MSSQNFAPLLQKISMWDDQYREKKTRGKTAKQLRKEGWWKTGLGNWTCMKMGAARNAYFKKDMEELIAEHVGIPKAVADYKARLRTGAKPSEEG